MKINNSMISMKSCHAYEKTSATLVSGRLFLKNPSQISQNGKRKGSEEEATITLSDKGKNLNSQMRKKMQMLEQQEQQRQQAEEISSSPVEMLKTDKDGTLEVLKRLLEILKQMREGKKTVFDVLNTKTQMPALKISNPISLDARSKPFFTAGTGNVWTRQTEYTTSTQENEVMAFSSTGTAMTEDGRSISFNVSMAMSRSFVEETSMVSEETVQILTDPLVINLDSNTVSVTDQKFLFDLDSDGKKDEMSFVSEGSGFLALDKNNDGVINDGSELFGTKSGDGFADLQAYDEDGNGWIDENDDVFSKLKVWTKDSNGKDQILTLKEANVGAIFLGNAKTQFSLNDITTNETNAKIQSTGIYLKETGEAGTIQHVDFAL